MLPVSEYWTVGLLAASLAVESVSMLESESRLESESLALACLLLGLAERSSLRRFPGLTSVSGDCALAWLFDVFIATTLAWGLTFAAGTALAWGVTFPFATTGARGPSFAVVALLRDVPGVIAERSTLGWFLTITPVFDLPGVIAERSTLWRFPTITPVFGSVCAKYAVVGANTRA